MSPSKSSGDARQQPRALRASTVSFAAFSLLLGLAQFGALRPRGGEGSVDRGDGVGAVAVVGDDDVARLIRADGIQQRQRRVLPVVLRGEQRLPRAGQLHVRLRDVEPRSGAGFELVLRGLQQPREEGDVRLPRVDLRLRALHDQVQPRHRGGDVVLRLLALIAARRWPCSSATGSAAARRG